MTCTRLTETKHAIEKTYATTCSKLHANLVFTLLQDPAKAEHWQMDQAAVGLGDGSSGANVHQLHPIVGGPGGEQRKAPTLLLTCNGHAVPYDFSLAAVKQWIFKRSDDLVLHYSLRDENTPLKLPAIRPP